MMLTLFHTPGTRSVRARWVLEELNIPHELKTYEYDGEYFASDEFRAINPMGKMPALYDGKELIIESIAIMQYVLDRFGSGQLTVAADDPEFAAYLQWLHMGESGMSGYIATSFGHAASVDPYKVTEAHDQYCRYQVEKALGMLEERLEGRTYILDRGFSAADISLGYALIFAAVCTGTTYSDRVQTYLSTLLKRPALQKALSDLPQEAVAALG